MNRLGRFGRRCQKRISTATALRVLWIVVVLWSETGVFWFTHTRCQWPDSSEHHPSTSSTVHVAVVADPQILDRHSYPGRPPVLTLLTRLIVDLNIRRNWRVVKNTRPHAIIFLGDLMDGGRRRISSQEYASLYRRFNSIFSISPHIPTYYLPGNHDVGLGGFPSSPDARQRFIDHFGPVNQHINLGNHSIVMIDAPRLVDGGGRADEIDKFIIQQSSTAERKDPVILFTHIPLWRPEKSSCGPLRERGTLRQGVGLGYQNMLERETTAFVLKNIRPSAVFSGDDHDYCEYSHDSLAYPPTTEITVKSFSMAMGILRPGFQMLSLHSETQTHESIPCDLPSVLLTIRSIYAPLILISILILLLFGSTRRERTVLPRYSERQKDDTTRYRLTTRETDGAKQGGPGRGESSSPMSIARCTSCPRKFSITGLARDITRVASWPICLWLLQAIWTFLIG